MSKEFTAEEVQRLFINQVKCVARYWATLKEDMTPIERCEGVAFSILNIIDGSSCLPAFDLVVRPHPDDKQYHIDEGEDYFPDGAVINNCMLHEIFFDK